MIRSTPTPSFRRSRWSLPATRARAACLAFALGTLLPSAGANGAPALRFELSAETLAFHLEGEAGSAPWVVQHSSDGRNWADFAFLEVGADGSAVPAVEVARAALPQRDARSAFFRAVQLAQDDPLLREILSARVKWRLAGIDDYRYRFRWSSQLFWLGTITVIDGEVAGYEMIEAYPPLDSPPLLETMEGFFDLIDRARVNGAERIDVTWDRQYGFPTSVFIDQSTMIADEEYGLTIDSFEPLP